MKALYLRKSREDTTNKEETLSRQLEALTALADTKGYKDYDVYQEVESSVSFNRPELTRLLENIGKYDGILVTHTDRLGRDIGLLDEIKKICIANGVHIITPDTVITFEDDNAEILYGFNSVLADFEYKKTRKKLIQGKINAIKHRGRWQSGKPPLGYRVNRESMTLVPHPDEKVIYRFIVNKALEGYSTGKIADMCRSNGWKGKLGKHIAPSSIRTILGNRTYLGEVHYNSVKYGHTKATNCHEPLISVSDFNQIQKLIRSRRNKDKISSQGVKTPIDNLVYCPLCAHYKVISKNTATGGYFIKKCKYRLPNGELCQNRGIKVTEVVNAVMEEVYRHKDVYKEQIERLLSENTSTEHEHLTDTINRLDRDIKGKEAALNKLLDLYLDGDMLKERYQTKKDLIHKEIEALTETKGQYEYERDSLDVDTQVSKLTHNLNRIEQLSSRSIEGQNRSLKTIIDRIEFIRDNDAVSIVISWL